MNVRSSYLRRKILVLINLIVVKHLAENFGLILEERLLFGIKRDFVLLHNILQGGIASEQIAVKGNSAGVQSGALRLRDLRHHTLCEIVGRHKKGASLHLVLRRSLHEGASSSLHKFRKCGTSEAFTLARECRLAGLKAAGASCC